MTLATSPARSLVAVSLAAGLFASACGGDDATASVEGVWARTSPMNADAGAVYFTIESDDDLTITGVSVSDDVAGRAELHETVMADMTDDMSDDAMEDSDMDEDAMDDGDEMDHDMGGAMMMQHVMTVDVPGGEAVDFEPGGLHVMLLDLPDPLELGETFELTLEVDGADSITVDVEVRDEAP